MTVEKIDHIGIAVEHIADRLDYYVNTLGLRLIGEEMVEDQRVRVALLEIGESRIELLEPTDESSPVAKFLSKYGERIHHIAVRVNDITSALEEHKTRGHRLIDETPRAGAHGTLIAFVHPKTTGGVLLELCQSTD